MENHNEHSEKYLVGIFDGESEVMHAVEEVRHAGVKIHEVYTPFPIHGLDIALGYKRSRLPRAAFMFGFLGTCTALTMMTWMMGFDWPMIIGGKDTIPLPNFVPVTFELTVLFAALGMVFTFLVTNDLYPGKTPKMFDIRSTDDKFVMAVALDENSISQQDITDLLRRNGAVEVNEKQFD
jgi:hypothetical protein